MDDNFFDHIGLADTGRHWPSLPEDDRIPQRFRGYFMSQQLDTTTAYNPMTLYQMPTNMEALPLSQPVTS